MKIRFKETSPKMINEIYVDDVYLGEVKNDIFNGSWVLHPDFEIKKIFASEKIINEKYKTAYEAGKALVKLYEKERPYKEEQIDFGFDSFDFDFGSDLRSYHDSYLFSQEVEK